MARIEFEVVGKPPKKIRGKSMWSSDSQSGLIQELRRAAYLAEEKSSTEFLHINISIEINIYASKFHHDPQKPEQYLGDLDNLISGICECFQKAPKLYKYLLNDPSKGNPIFYNNDNQITSIHAFKHILSDQEPTYYTISIETA